MPRRLPSLFAALLLACAPPAPAANNYPVVLVHGFLGFGPDQFPRSGFKYWGGYGDIAAHMRVYKGPRAVFTAAVGPVSSNWDRAAELYAQIKGGCVDYGAGYARRPHPPGQQRQPAGKCWAADPANNPHNYPLAIYPAWDAFHPIHLVGHSQGGNTARALVQLLEHGAPGEGDSELYRGGKAGWVRSVTTLAAPHNGTTLRDAVLDFLPDPPAPLRAMFDTAHWELAPDGARDFNRWAVTSPNVYYYSLATQATEAGSYCCNHTDRLIAPVQTSAYQYPRADMIAFFKPWAGEWIVPSLFQAGMGSYTQFKPGRVRIDSSWFANDGVVNTASMRAPAGHPARDYDGSQLRGTWNFLGIYRGFDHFDVLNWPNRGPSADPIYDRISDIIFSLP